MTLPISGAMGDGGFAVNPNSLDARIGVELPRPVPDGTTAPAEPTFGGILSSVVDRANAAEHNASTRVEALAAGATDDIHGTMIAVREAEITTTLVSSIRTKLLDAFHELWRTSV